MSEANRETVEANKSRIEAALIEYFAILDRGESVHLETFLAKHAEISTDLRSYITFDENVRGIAKRVKLQDAPLHAAPAASTLSVLGSTGQTSAGRSPDRASSPLGRTVSSMSPKGLPATFGRYEVEKQLGSGAMGVVYLAFDTLLERKVALKIPTFADDADGELRRRFYREARAVSKIKHLNLCSVYDVGEIDGWHYMSMEFVPGKRLTDFIKPQMPMSENQAMAIVRKVAMAMHEAHAHGVIHRDLKPDNIMINHKGEPVVMDFGLVHKMGAENSTRISQEGALIGSPAYMSPEQVEGDHEKLTAATDQYSLGVIFYQLLVSRTPFEGGMQSVLTAILTKDPVPPTRYRPDLNRCLEAVCMKMMAKRVEDRYSSMKEIADAIAEAVRGMSAGSTRFCLPDVNPLSLDDVYFQSQLDVAAEQEPLSGVQIGVYDNRLRCPRLRWPDLYRGFAGVAVLVAVFAAYTVTLKLKGRDGQSAEISVSVEASDNRGLGTRADANVDQRALTTSVSGQSKTSHSQKIRDHSPPRAEEGWHGWPANAPKPAIAPFSAAQAKLHQQAWANYLHVPVELTNSIGMKLVLLPPGEFRRGSTAAEIEEGLTIVGNYKPVRDYLQGQKTRHTVVLTQPKYIGVHEVTRAQFQRVTGQSPSGARNGKLAEFDTSNFPVDNVNWFDAVTFCARLSNLEKLDYNVGYCLPTEAEWQVSCLSGAETKYWSGNSEAELARIGWYGPNSGGRPHAVGELAPNPFGLFDVHGNVVEWCHDRWNADYLLQFHSKAAVDPRGPASARNPGLVKGGDCHFTEFDCRANIGFPTDSWYSDERFGFRIVLPVPADKLSQNAARVPAMIDRTAVIGGKGLWHIQGDELVHAKSEVASLLFGSCEWTDYDYYLELMREEDGDGIHIYFRTQDLGNSCFLGLGVYGNKWHETAHYLKGNWGREVALIPNRSLPVGEWQKVLVKVRGNHFTLRLNDEELFAYDEFRFPCGLVGFRTFDCKTRFRNLKVTDPAGAVLWEGFPEFPEVQK